jgi:hypothetical protein
MLQFYFLSVALNICSGFVLYSAKMETKSADSAGVLAALVNLSADATLRMLFGTLSVLTGFFKLLSVAPGDVPIIGDLVPAIIGIVIGLTLLLDIYRVKPAARSRIPEGLEKIILKYKPVLGLSGIAVGLIHFLFPSVLLV